jgi:hypothetical protein
MKVPFKYSYLQWDVGYVGYFFQSQYLNGFGLDLIGAVFNNDFDLAFGFTGTSGGYNYGVTPTMPDVHSYSTVYIKAEPMLFPDRLLNISIPVLFSMDNFSYTMGNNPYIGGGRRGRAPGISFPAISGGINLLCNLFKRVSLGAGADYRFGFGRNSYSTFKLEYNNFTTQVFLRFRLNTRKKVINEAKDRNDYYTPK